MNKTVSPGRNRRGRRSRDVSKLGPDPVDLHVGRRLLNLRVFHGMGQQALADAVHLTFQQIQKYERGVNRISASRLFDFSLIFNVPVGFFFDEMPEEVRNQAVSERYLTAANEISFPNDPLQRRDSLELLRHFYGIEDEEQRKRIVDLVKSMSKRPAEDTPG